MTSDTTYHHVHQLEIVETGRRRRFSAAEKQRIVEESCAAPRLVSATARRHGISPSQLFVWRKALRVRNRSAEPSQDFIPAVVVPDPSRHLADRHDSRMEIITKGSARVIVGPAVDCTALARVLDLLERR